jgi:predicted PurR-regulated permease PerM
MTVAVLGMAYAAWRLSSVLILAFAAVLVAVLLVGLANVIETHTRLPWPWAFTTGVLVIALFLIGVIVLFGAQLAGQIDEVISRIPRAFDEAGRRIGIADASSELVNALSSASGSRIVSQAARLGYTFIGMVADLVLVVAAAIYLGADRSFHLSAIKLLPPNQQERALSAMVASAHALRLWFLGQLISMILVGLLSGLAFWAIGLPLPLGLGLIAGLANFIPLLGPILGAIPAVILAMADDWAKVVWSVLAIVAIQQVEGYVILPLVQRRAVDASPAILLFAIATFGVLFGWMGIVMAVPLTVVLMVLVQKIWVREVLGEKTTVPGEKTKK